MFVKSEAVLTLVKLKISFFAKFLILTSKNRSMNLSRSRVCRRNFLYKRKDWRIR